MSTTVAPSVPPNKQTVLAQMASFRRFTVAEYHELIRLGVLTTEDRVELIDGYLMNKVPQNDPHASAITRLTEDLVRACSTGWQVRIQLPITIGNSEPEPDAAVVRGDRRTYDHRRPTGTDFGVVIEVADTTLRFDRQVKSAEYASAGIPVYWIVNLIDGQIEMYTDPDPTSNPPSYRSRIDYPRGQSVVLVLDGQVVAQLPVADILP